MASPFAFFLLRARITSTALMYDCIELRKALLSYQDYHVLLLTLRPRTAHAAAGVRRPPTARDCRGRGPQYIIRLADRHFAGFNARTALRPYHDTHSLANLQVERAVDSSF